MSRRKGKSQSDENTDKTSNTVMGRTSKFSCVALTTIPDVVNFTCVLRSGRKGKTMMVVPTKVTKREAA